MNRRGRTIAFICMAAVALGSQLVPARAAGDDQAGHNVVQYFDLVYSQQQCSGETAYKIQYAAMRWYRENNNRRISSAPFNMGRVGTQNCGGSMQQPRQMETNINPRFEGPGDNWTQQYTRTPDWTAYSVEGVIDSNVLGANLKGVIRNGNGDFLGSLCSRVYLIGNGSC